MSARERALSLARDAVIRHVGVSETPLIRCICGVDRLTITEHTTHVATAVIAALEAGLGMHAEAETEDCGFMASETRETGRSRLITDWTSA